MLVQRRRRLGTLRVLRDKRPDIPSPPRRVPIVRVETTDVELRARRLRRVGPRAEQLLEPRSRGASMAPLSSCSFAVVKSVPAPGTPTGPGLASPAVVGSGRASIRLFACSFNASSCARASWTLRVVCPSMRLHRDHLPAHRVELAVGRGLERREARSEDAQRVVHPIDRRRERGDLLPALLVGADHRRVDDCRAASDSLAARPEGDECHSSTRDIPSKRGRRAGATTAQRFMASAASVRPR